MSQAPDPACPLLLQGLSRPLDVDVAKWDRLLRLARRTGLHARLAETHLDGDVTLADPVRRHLLSAKRVAEFRTQMVRAELFRLAPLCRGDFPVVVLKGGAYILQERRLSRGRFVSDVDLLVPQSQLRTMEERLRQAGWQTAPLDPYDERYYRDWSHETPPMRFPGRTLEVDLHHALTPVTGRLAFNPQCLFETIRLVTGSPFHVLAPEDQVLHACLHCFQDGDLELRVREVVDIDGLVRELAPEPKFWDQLVRRAGRLGLERPLWYGLSFARLWLGCPIPEQVLAGLPAPSRGTTWIMDRLVPLAMLPPDPDYPEPAKVRWARRAMLARYHLQRMPAGMLVPHLARKVLRRTLARHVGSEAEENNGA
ncbi:MAG: nucleotidyltransferase family protein [Zoogloeaceae bacterium]|nr:nucleotidyltransferase family protein [Zoogloeaceae bacterium]